MKERKKWPFCLAMDGIVWNQYLIWSDIIVYRGGNLWLENCPSNLTFIVTFHWIPNIPLNSQSFTVTHPKNSIEFQKFQQISRVSLNFKDFTEFQKFHWPYPKIPPLAYLLVVYSWSNLTQIQIHLDFKNDTLMTTRVIMTNDGDSNYSINTRTLTICLILLSPWYAILRDYFSSCFIYLLWKE